ncbi:hypothetical protein BGZ61DRAFT_486064 [Ilyonectria robusta]|uniref:uncharacterized protein n=1 Tax=Ilyonectria robusta TaxID=1079257 RepID=UPI001E8D721D|nr:uncharacterized protein BGZ61DRAFT_486064 [Ilyonectria robusta]KAH6953897.1 hypothetical protein BKA56DRAFT_681669 [Ilyonectria sp. MPI-CAGE-AT-0026]KAH8658873.1 hypothetical protein BGZ61DRAFT_486064 [Ilyonectria robusta]
MAFDIERFREKIIQAIQSADVGEIVLGILKIPEVSNVIYNDDRVQEFAPKFRDILAISPAPTPSPHLTGNLTTTLPTAQASQGNRPVLYRDDTSQDRTCRGESRR